MKKFQYKHSSLLSCSINDEDGKFYTAATRWSSTLRPKKKWTTKNTFGPSNRSTVSSHLFIKSLTALAAPTECYKLPVDYPCLSSPSSGNTKRGSITVPLTSCLTGLVCFANKNENCMLSYSWFQSSQTGGQWYSDTSPFSIPCLHTNA